MKMHGGNIGVYSAGEGRGCTFYIDLPVLRIQTKSLLNRLPNVTAATNRLLTSSAVGSIRELGMGMGIGSSHQPPTSSPPHRFPFHHSSSSSSNTTNANPNNVRSNVTSNRNSSNYPSIFSHQSANSTYSTPSLAPLVLVPTRSPSRSRLQPQQPLVPQRQLKRTLSQHFPHAERRKQRQPLQRLKRVLIVDDSAMNRKLLKRSLQNIVDSCDEAVHGRDCLEKVKQAMEKDREAMDAAGMINIQQPQPMGYEVIITDYFMPEMNGLEAIGHLRKAEGDFKYGGMIIGLTGNADEATKLAFEEAGANVVLTKPFSTDQLQSILQGKSL